MYYMNICALYPKGINIFASPKNVFTPMGTLSPPLRMQVLDVPHYPFDWI